MSLVGGATQLVSETSLAVRAYELTSGYIVPHFGPHATRCTRFNPIVEVAINLDGFRMEFL